MTPNEIIAELDAKLAAIEEEASKPLAQKKTNDMPFAFAVPAKVQPEVAQGSTAKPKRDAKGPRDFSKTKSHPYDERPYVGKVQLGSITKAPAAYTGRKAFDNSKFILVQEDEEYLEGRHISEEAFAYFKYMNAIEQLAKTYRKHPKAYVASTIDEQVARNTEELWNSNDEQYLAYLDTLKTELVARRCVVIADFDKDGHPVYLKRSLPQMLDELEANKQPAPPYVRDGESRVRDLMMKAARVRLMYEEYGFEHPITMAATSKTLKLLVAERYGAYFEGNAGIQQWKRIITPAATMTLEQATAKVGHNVGHSEDDLDYTDGAPYDDEDDLA